MRHLLVLAAAMIAVPAGASNYSASPAKPATQQRIIHKGILWTCRADACRTATEESRPTILCQGLAKRVGRLEIFIAGGRRFTPGELDRCNLSARD